ncbi:hypothetical protein NKF26_23410 [Haladaptatus sp. AB618]|uniref:hypothetical protein n=1 Tax=Haladaptatus sp. AB618 TaxID=2934173 RepID=UPI00209C00AD|nr:hypothetical protein [Haladaptatus sp. AB618]MCO8256774.1 hypothetical protein [Haladaptatus sp. AB618]
MGIVPKKVSQNRRQIIWGMIILGLLVSLSFLVYGLVILRKDGTNQAKNWIQFSSNIGTLVGVVFAAWGVYLTQSHFVVAYNREKRDREQVALYYLQQSCHRIKKKLLDIQSIPPTNEEQEKQDEYHVDTKIHEPDAYNVIEDNIHKLTKLFPGDISGEERYEIIKHQGIVKDIEDLGRVWNRNKNKYPIESTSGNDEFEAILFDLIKRTDDRINELSTMSVDPLSARSDDRSTLGASDHTDSNMLVGGDSLATTEGIVERETTYTPRMYKAGGFLLMLSGVIGTIVGVGLLITSDSISMLGLSGLGTATVGIIVLVFSIIEFAGGASAYRGQNWYGSITAGVLGLVTIFTLPLDLIGTLLIALGEGEFDRKEEVEEEPELMK